MIWGPHAMFNRAEDDAEADDLLDDVA